MMTLNHYTMYIIYRLEILQNHMLVNKTVAALINVHTFNGAHL